MYLKLILSKNIFRVFGDKFSIIGSPIVKSIRFRRIISKSSVFYRISSISINLTPKTRKIFFEKISFKIKFANFDFWFSPKQKYGSRGQGKIAQSVFIAILRFLIGFLLFLLTKIVGTLYPPIPGSEIDSLSLSWTHLLQGCCCLRRRRSGSGERGTF